MQPVYSCNIRIGPSDYVVADVVPFCSSLNSEAAEQHNKELRGQESTLTFSTEQNFVDHLVVLMSAVNMHVC